MSREAMKHTPGPWFSQYDDNGFYEIGSEAVTLRLAFTYGEGDTDEANARLIAAAPDLLEALRNLELGANTVNACYTRNPGNFAATLRDLREYAAAARAVIAKATGGEV